MWWIPLVLFAVSRCDGVEVMVDEEKKFAPLFEEVVLQCHYSSSSSQPAVIQWWYKSYCRDRTRDSFSFPESMLLQNPELGSSHLDCADSTRTVHIMASIRGSSVTIGERYRSRDISIINEADLRIGRLQWGDSGVYHCKVVISDDPEGKNEAQVQLLVLGKIGPPDDLLPRFDIEFMPEWAFVGVVILGTICCLLVVGICWCKCCPHSCCCYLPCCCCCARRLYEAGQAVKPLYFISGIPSMVPIIPPFLVDPKMATGLPSDTTGASSLLELSSGPEGDSELRQSCHTLPPIADSRDQPDLQGATSGHRQLSAHHPHHGNQSEEHHSSSRWNPRSEHLQRKPFRSGERAGGRVGVRTGSLDTLEEFALSYSRRARRRELGDGRQSSALELRESDSPRRQGEGRSGAWPEQSQRRLHRRDQDGPPAPPQRRKDAGDGERGAARGHEDGLLRPGRGEGDGFHSDSTSKASSKKSSDCYLSMSPGNRPKEGDRPPEPRPFARSPPTQGPPNTLQEHREEMKPRKANCVLNRDSLIV
ncbi:hypothetical protein MATL_G00177410 [Megalops atlanticus]|uniref:Ig-like domain-containing protein n=1 Tax=Megalops atlanticus TaxID=7932 RepID=A0A9D3PP33_MEGAT|nr:hypothetical protein MATL_G00177410 [Megalops atlanticus]